MQGTWICTQIFQVCLGPFVVEISLFIGFIGIHYHTQKQRKSDMKPQHAQAPVVKTLDSAIHQVPVVQKMDSAFHKINHYPVDKY